jgi:NAD(P)-dependent dehydrogenase (short-subunit alcohol dehydrogenase family)
VSASELPRLEGRVALITGGSRGIGQAIALAFAQAGATTTIVARDTEELRRSAEAIARDGKRPLTIAGDVSSREFCITAVQRVERELGALDVLVNAAGIQGPIGAMETLDEAAVRQTLDVNLFGTMWMMQAAIPVMKQRGRGAIVNLSGGGATSARPMFSAYAMSKVAVVRLTESAAIELESHGIRINAIAPGAVNTRMTDEVERAGDRAGARAREEVRVQRESGGADPRIAAALAVWLASDKAAHVTGRLISALWDEWQALISSGKPLDPDAFTLRRR